MKNLLMMAACVLALNINWLFGQQEMDFGWTSSSPSLTSSRQYRCGTGNGTVTLTTNFNHQAATATNPGDPATNGVQIPLLINQSSNDFTVTLTFVPPVSNPRIRVIDIDYESGIAKESLHVFLPVPTTVTTVHGSFSSTNPLIPSHDASSCWLEYNGSNISSISFDYWRTNSTYAMLLDSMTFDCNTCFADIDPAFTHITSPILNITNTPSGVRTWDGKYYVDRNVTVDGITLDVTGTDVVFAPCTRITLINGAQLRANNSTFRPCNPNDCWDGIYFTSTGALHSSAVVNECVFKNAIDALRFEDSFDANKTARYSARITTNSFIDCWKGIYVTGPGLKEFQEGITGNTFTIDNRNIAWQLRDVAGVCQPFSSTNFTGISAANTTFSGQISQNDFINTSDLQPSNLLGILWNSCKGRISLNNFTNNQRAMQLNRCQVTSVENNRIELTQFYEPYITQILVEKGNNVWVTGNHLSNTTETDRYNPAGAAITMESCEVVNVKENQVDGFGNGIQFFETYNSAITENILTNCNVVGIMVDGGAHDSVSCNQVKMHLTPNDLVVNAGIYYLHTIDEAPSMSIKGNCITDASFAIALDNATGTVYRIPRLHNNYLYNYTIYGVFSSRFDGDQGSGIANSSQAARNTFSSNNFGGGAIDIETNGETQTWYGNFGINAVSAGVTLVGSGAYQSIASCGLQIGGTNSSIGVGEICDFFSYEFEGGNRMLRNSDFSEFQSDKYGNQRAHMAVGMLLGLLDDDETQAAANFKSWIDGSTQFTTLDKAWVDYNYLVATDQTDAALNALATLEGLDAYYRDFAVIARLRQKLAQEGRDYSEFTADEIGQLEAIDDARFAWADDARDLLHFGFNTYPHILKPIPTITLDENMQQRILDANAESLTIFPNPASSQVTIEYVLKNVNGATIKIYDITGRVVYQMNLEADLSHTTLDISALNAGIYLVSLSNVDGHVKTAKLQVQ